MSGTALRAVPSPTPPGPKPGAQPAASRVTAAAVGPNLAANAQPQPGLGAMPGDDDSSQGKGPAKRVLRMLTGSHTGAESELTNDRLLIGNLESECDVVIDVSRPERHICLVRASQDGWTVLSIAGDLWVGDQYVAQQQTSDITSGTVLTLGRVAFCVADTHQIEWADVVAPTNLVKPEPEGPLPTVVLPPSGEAKLRKWHAVKLAAGIGIAALTMASAGAYLTNAWAIKTPTPEEAVAKLKAEQAVVTALPFGKELNLQPDPNVPNKVQVLGYLPKREQARALERALRDAEIDASEFHVVALDELGSELTRRFNRAKVEQIHYEEKGRFLIDSKSDVLDAHDKLARQTLQEVPLLSGLSLSVEDVRDPAGKPIVVRYDRSVDHPGDIVVSELDVIKQRQRYTIKEMRLGSMPSIVLENGMRYFEGATLPDASVLKKIGATELVVAQGRGERTIPLPAEIKEQAQR
jgi:Inner membrane component of T3SS, cytoplasmic domain